jgi:hypothetical protein
MSRAKLESTSTKHPMTQPFQTTFILFVDMLGFAALVEKEGDELNELSPIFTGVELYSPSPAESLLGYRFINFHRCLNQARVRLQEMGEGTAIVFSDSAFFPACEFFCTQISSRCWIRTPCESFQ